MYNFRAAVGARTDEPAPAPTPAIELHDMAPRPERPAPVVLPREHDDGLDSLPANHEVHYDGVLDSLPANQENPQAQVSQPSDLHVWFIVFWVLSIGFLVLVGAGVVVFCASSSHLS